MAHLHRLSGAISSPVRMFSVPFPSSVVSSRIGPMMQDANFDALEPMHGAMPRAIMKLADSPSSSTLIYDLIQANLPLYEKFLNNRFCRGMARNVLLLDIYQDFAKQDYLYLLDSIRFKALRFSKSNFRSDLSVMRTDARKISSAVDYAEEWRRTIINKLSVPASSVDKTDSSIAEIAYAGFLQNNTSLDSWLSLYIMTVPCIYGWNQIAMKLENDPNTVKDTVFYQNWIQPNLDQQYAQKLSNFLEANKAVYESEHNKMRWNELFRTSLKLELGLFDSVVAGKSIASNALSSTCTEGGRDYIFYFNSEDRLCYLSGQDSSSSAEQVIQIRDGEGLSYITSENHNLASTLFEGEQVHVYYVDNNYSLAAVWWHGYDSEWKTGLINRERYKADPDSGITALGYQELHGKPGSIRLKVYFKDLENDRKLTSAKYQDKKWSRKVV